MKSLAWLIVALLPLIPRALPDEGHHHEEMTAEQLGTVHFPVSCSPSVQKPFESGVALLHSFWYEEAAKQFEQVAKDDPQCAMAPLGSGYQLVASTLGQSGQGHDQTRPR